VNAENCRNIPPIAECWLPTTDGLMLWREDLRINLWRRRLKPLANSNGIVEMDIQPKRQW